MVRFDWQLNFLSVHACQPSEGGKRLTERLLLSTESLAEENEILEGLLDELLVSLFKKKPDTGKSSACKAFSFLETGSGQGDKRMLTRGLEAENLEQFESVATDLASRYADIDGARPALVLVVRSRVTTPADVVLPFLVMFACDFEEVSLLTGRSEGLLERIGEAVVHRLRKAIVYPLVDQGIQNLDRLILFQAAASEHFDEMVALEEPVNTPELFAGEVKQALEKRVQEPPAYQRYFKEPPPATRELFGEERYVRLEHLLPSDEVKHVSDVSFKNSKEKFDKEMKLKISLGDFGRFEAKMDRFNRDFFFARRGNEKYLIVRAENFVIKDQLTPVEFVDVEDLEQVFKNLLG